MINIIRIAALIVFTLCIAIAPLSVFADTGVSETEELKKEMSILRERLSALESRLQQSEAKVVKIEKEKVAPEAGLPSAVTAFAKEIEVHGSVDTSYIFNTNTPVAPNTQTNNLRVFDREANGFMLNLAELNFEKPISQESPVGFRVDLAFGEDAEVFHAAGLGEGAGFDEFDLQQAYAQFYVPFSLPFMHALNFKVGKFVTLHGAEVIESADNWNFSRSFLFGYAIPFTHTGIRAYYKPFENMPVDSYIGIVNGWDNARDNNRAKTVEGSITATPFENLSFTLNGIFGPERANSNKDFRNLVDFVATYKIFDKLTLKANYDYGWERNGASATAGSVNDKDATWDGIAAYAKYDIFDWWSVAGRGEFFHDRDGVRTLVLTSATMPMTDLELWEFTITNEFKLYQNLIARLEYRYDKASGQAFTKDKVTSNNQSTISAEVIAKF